MTKPYVTTLTRANSKGESLRTTVPSSIAKHYDLKEGDKIGWHFDAKNGEIFVIVSPYGGKRNDR